MLGMNASAAIAARASHPADLSRVVAVALLYMSITDLGAGTVMADYLFSAETPRPEQEQLIGKDAYRRRSNR